MKKHEPILREGEANKRKSSHKAIADVGAARSHYTIMKTKATRAENAWETERKKFDKAVQFRDIAEEELNAAQEIIDMDPLPEGAQPVKRIQERDKLKFKKEQLDVAVNAQEAKLAEAWSFLRLNERNLFAADKEMHILVDRVDEAVAEMEAQKDLDHIYSERLAKNETGRVKQWESRQKKAINARAHQLKELSDLASSQIDEAKRLNKEATKRLDQQLDKTKKFSKSLRKHKDMKHEDRTEQVLELKANTDAVNMELKGAASKYRTKVKLAQEELEREKESMLAKGLNPYSEFRKREFDAEARHRKKALKQAVEENKANLAERMIKEEEDRRKEEAIDLKNRKLEKAHRDEQGRHVTEERNEEYIKSVTVGNLEVLDPAGRAARVDPSQVTEIVDNSFGTGKSARIPKKTMNKITQRIRDTLKLGEEDLGEYRRLVSNILPEQAGTPNSKASRPLSGTMGAAQEMGMTMDDAGAMDAMQEWENAQAERATQKRLIELKSLADKMGPMPGTDGAPVELNLAEGTEEVARLLKLAAEENLGDDGSGDVDALQDAPIPKYTWREQTKFEVDAFERAKGRMRTRLVDGTTQIAGGREFKGQAFIPKPEQVMYKDFEVGKVYTRRFTLTNTSYTFNSFRLLDLADDVIDFFVIKYTKPGRMSAGMSCPLEVTFSPKINTDIFSSINFYTETGPVSVPLVCLMKRCAPVVLTPSIAFDELVIGQKNYLPLMMKNSEILGTDFEVVRIDPTSVKITPVSTTTEVASSSGISGQGVAEGDAVDVEVAADVEGTVEGAEEGAITTAVDDDIKNEEAEKDVADSLELLPEDPPLDQSPAGSTEELWSRVRVALTKVLRQKKREDPRPISVQLFAVGGGAGIKRRKDGEESEYGEKLQCEGVLHGYSECKVEVKCAPLAVGPFEQRFFVHFNGVVPDHETKDEEGRLIQVDQEVVVRGSGVEMPIYAAEEVIDMRCTLHDRIYRRRVELRNRGKTAYRVNINIPAPFNKYIEVSPDMLFVQGGASQEVNLKFAPQADLLERLPHFTKLHDEFVYSAAVAIPVEMTIVGQELPVFFVIKSDITPSTLQLSSTALNYGKVYVNQRSTQKLKVKNLSMLPQKIGFVKLPKEALVSPNDGFAVMLPNEETEFEISFAPSAPTSYNFPVTLLTSLNDTYNIIIQGTGVEPPVVFDTSVIQMRTTCPGERVLESISVQNKSSRRQCFEVMPPKDIFTWLKISPTIFDLEPNEAARIEVQFLPPRDCGSRDPSEWYKSTSESQKSPSSLEGEGGEETSPETDMTIVSPFDQWNDPRQRDLAIDSRWVWGSGAYGTLQWSLKEEENSKKQKSSESEVDVEAEADGENVLTEVKKEGDEEQPEEEKVPLFESDWGIIGKWNLPIFVKARPGTTSDVPPLFLSVETTVVLPELVVDFNELDFGQMAIGTRQLKSIRVRNMSNKDIHLKSFGINAVGPFTVLPFVRNLAPGATQNLVVECCPPRPGLITEVLELSPDSGRGHQLRITLKSLGVDPVVELQGLLTAPNNWSAQGGILYMGVGVRDDMITKSFSIFNKSDFEVKASIFRAISEGLPPFQQSELVQRTASGLPVFTFSPEQASIASGETLTVNVTFRADRLRNKPFREDIYVSVGQADGLIKVCLVGKTVDRQCYVIPANSTDEQFIFQSKAVKNVLDVQVEDLLSTENDDEIRKLGNEARETIGLQLKTPTPIALEFPDAFADDADPSTYEEIEVGAGGKKGESSNGGRKQIKSLQIGATDVQDGRAGAGNGTYEVLLGEEAKSSGLFTLALDKGACTAGSSTQVDIACTLPTPRGIGGLKVGSWQTYPCEVVLKGGWKPDGDADEVKIPFLLRAFVGL